jgi:hypothetical protein
MPSQPATLDVPVAVDSDRDQVAEFYRRADALFRCAVECCRQHERRAKLMERGALGAELRAAQALVEACDDSLAQLAGCYERAAGRAHPPKENGCWRAANGLWMASREYARRQRTSARATKSICDTGEHSTRLAELAVDFDLEASALLQLKHATESYKKTRPQAAA